MKSPRASNSPEANPAEAAQAAESRAARYRERFRQAQLIASQVAKARMAGAVPGENEADRLVAEFHARGGQVTVCPPGSDVPPGTEPGGKPSGRSSRRS
ncbi:hypothetical protein [Falsiroseomonas sp. HW251]|uniref:hypothetical protein n=1 Tax=Falsiroseomonas sp. HW251 TaxID=3390998 RepID=UPI003D31BDCC